MINEQILILAGIQVSVAALFYFVYVRPLQRELRMYKRMYKRDKLKIETALTDKDAQINSVMKRVTYNDESVRALVRRQIKLLKQAQSPDLPVVRAAVEVRELTPDDKEFWNDLRLLEQYQDKITANDAPGQFDALDEARRVQERIEQIKERSHIAPSNLAT